jgi:hypothetical protein
MASQHSIGWHVQRGAKGGAVIGAILASAVLVAHYVQLATGVDTAGAGMGTGILIWIGSVPFGLALIYAVAALAPTMPGFLESPAAALPLILLLGVVSNWLALGAAFGLVRAWLTREIPPPAT